MTAAVAAAAALKCGCKSCHTLTGREILLPMYRWHVHRLRGPLHRAFCVTWGLWCTTNCYPQGRIITVSLTTGQPWSASRVCSGLMYSICRGYARHITRSVHPFNWDPDCLPIDRATRKTKEYFLLDSALFRRFEQFISRVAYSRFLAVS